MFRLSLKGARLTEPLLLAALSFSLQAADTPDASLDIDYAEALPLSTESLMLDIVALPGGGFIAAGERGHIILSESGDDWRQANVVPTRSTLTTLYSRGDRIWAAGHDTVILTSADGGETWTRQYFDADRQQPIMDIYFFDDNRGIAIGAYGLALETEDGGLNWTDGLINEEEWHNNAIMDKDGTDIMVAAEAGLSYRSRDGGASWEILEMPYPGSMFGIVEGNKGCALLFGLRGHIQESCDFGDSWTELESGTESSIAGALRSNDRTILVGNSGLVLTQSGSGSFTSEIHSSGVDFAAIVSRGNGQFLLAGENGIHQYPESAQAEQ